MENLVYSPLRSRTVHFLLVSREKREDSGVQQPQIVLRIKNGGSALIPVRSSCDVSLFVIVGMARLLVHKGQ